MNRSDKQAIDPIQRVTAKTGRHSGLNTLLQFSSSAFGKGKGHNPLGCHTVGEQISNALRNHFGLAGTSRGNNLHMRPTVLNSGESFTLKLRNAR